MAQVRNKAPLEWNAADQRSPSASSQAGMQTVMTDVDTGFRA